MDCVALHVSESDRIAVRWGWVGCKYFSHCAGLPGLGWVDRGKVITESYQPIHNSLVWTHPLHWVVWCYISIVTMGWYDLTWVMVGIRWDQTVQVIWINFHLDGQALDG